MKRWAAAAFLTAAFPAALPAQSETGRAAQLDQAIADLPLDQRFYTLLMNGRYLDAFAEVEGADPGGVSDGLRSSYRQMRPNLDGFHFVDPAAPPPQPPEPAALAAYDGAVAQDAIAAIVERARDRRIVIVNEAHDSPRDRAFILKLVEALRPLGFTHFGAETFVSHPPELASAAMSRLESERYPVLSTGTYTVDPMFGYLVRRAMALGYRPVAYEFAWTPASAGKSRQESIAERDQAQAENLARTLKAAGPDARLLIHVGYSHATERPLPDGTEWMAGRLARLTGLDPLTIDQTSIGEGGNAGLQRMLAERLDGAPAVFFKNGAPVRSGPYTEAVDLQVIHPPVTVVQGRPDWLRDTGRRALAIPAELLPTTGRRLVQLFVAGEADDAVPLDQALVTAGGEPPVLYAPEGVELRWAVQD